MNEKRFGILFIALFIIFIIAFSSFIIIVDPYFHYHKPLSIFHYKMDRSKQRYINDGIVKNFEYDAIIVGTSMVENFQTTQMDTLFGTNSIKVPLTGAYYKEINDLLSTAFAHNDHIQYVVRSLDYSYFFIDKDAYAYSKSTYPRYLYNNNILDDVQYILNKKVFLNTFAITDTAKSTTFDEYSYWGNSVKYGIVDYQRTGKREAIPFSADDLNLLRNNLQQNVIKLIEKHPNTQFYLFYPPYSIYKWDSYNQAGKLYKFLYGEKMITEMLLPYQNVHIFSFLDMYDIVTNINYYKDITHYHPDINLVILNSMKTGLHELTMENYEDYYKEIIPFYINYNYDALFE